MTNRLTEKTKIGYFAQYDRWSGDNKQEIIEKCGKYEDIEEELGIDLITLIELLKNRKTVYYNETPTYGDIIPAYIVNINLRDCEITFATYADQEITYKLSEYEEQFSFNKDELASAKEELLNDK